MPRPGRTCSASPSAPSRRWAAESVGGATATGQRLRTDQARTPGGTMAKKVFVLLALLVVRGGRMPAQRFPPGCVDPAPLLAAVAKEIGEANLKCITFSGAGYSGAVGQTFENAMNVDWPRTPGGMTNYTRTINWETGTSKETID